MEHRSELIRLLSSLCDEQLGEAEHARLEELLADADARRFYLQYVDMHSRLLTHPSIGRASSLPGVDALAGAIGEAAAEGSVQPMKREPRRATKHLRRLASYACVAAATLLATILVQYALSRPQRPKDSPLLPSPLAYVATLSQAVNAEWGPATEAYRTGTRVLAGELELKSGLVRLAYDGGIELIVEGPARLRLESESAATLLSGKIVFRADDASRPFTLGTPSSILIDLGTEYAVEVAADREEVHVFSGEVQRLAKAAPQTAKSELLAAGKARRYAEGAQD